MEEFLDLVLDNTSLLGRWVTTAVILAVALLADVLGGRLATRRRDDPYERYYARKLARYAVTVMTLVVLAVYWRPAGGQVLAVLGFAAAGVASRCRS